MARPSVIPGIKARLEAWLDEREAAYLSQPEDIAFHLALMHSGWNLRDELGYFADLREKYLAMPDVQEMFALCEDTGEPVTSEIEEALA